ncbi:MAG: hypothetical protein IPH21_02100 [Flavobacteriales bacterium]|nr:hypothetical protein [Flavobacteriales bacterium]HQV52129.1 hypothetical protein [Flavobacteriales bacterium]
MKDLAHTSYRNGHFTVNGKLLAEPTSSPDTDLNNAWSALGIELPRFPRMDRSSKLVAICGSSFFIEGGALAGHSKETIGMVIMGKHGSMDTDSKYQAQLDADNHASPGQFVYTLPNIAMGEFSIQHGLYGSGLCLLNNAPDLSQMREACVILLHDHGMDAIVCGWSDIFADQATATFMVVTERTLADWNAAELEKIFNDH